MYISDELNVVHTFLRLLQPFICSAMGLLLWFYFLEHRVSVWLSGLDKNCFNISTANMRLINDFVLVLDL